MMSSNGCLGYCSALRKPAFVDLDSQIVVLSGVGLEPGLAILYPGIAIYRFRFSCEAHPHISDLYLFEVYPIVAESLRC